MNIVSFDPHPVKELLAESPAILPHASHRQRTSAREAFGITAPISAAILPAWRLHQCFSEIALIGESFGMILSESISIRFSSCSEDIRHFISFGKNTFKVRSIFIAKTDDCRKLACWLLLSTEECVGGFFETPLKKQNRSDGVIHDLLCARKFPHSCAKRKCAIIV